MFAAMYPLFALLQGLNNVAYYRDPSREVLAAEYQARGDKRAFLRTRAAKLAPDDESALRDGLRRLAFGTHFHEIFSDGLLLLNSYYTNNYRGAGISLRCMLEDLYRSLYYRDHPEELDLVAQEKDMDEPKLGLKPATLREYLTRVSYLKPLRALTVEFSAKALPNEADIFALNEDLYGRCSSFVHASKSESMAALQSNEDLVHNKRGAGRILSASADVVRVAVAFLIPAYLDHFIAFNDYEKSIVLMAFSETARGNYRQVFNV